MSVPCQCCDFGNHTESCTCDGEECCHKMYVTLLRELRERSSGNDNYPALLDAFRDEVLGGAAEKIRMYGFELRQLFEGKQAAAVFAAADSIDPEAKG